MHLSRSPSPKNDKKKELPASNTLFPFKEKAGLSEAQTESSGCDSNPVEEEDCGSGLSYHGLEDETILPGPTFEGPPTKKQKGGRVFEGTIQQISKGQKVLF